MKARSQHPQEIWISGVNPIRETLQTKRMTIHEMVFARSDPRIQELLEWGTRRGIPMRQETRDRLSALVGHGHHQGIALHVGEFPYSSLEHILEPGRDEREPVLLLDSIQDPQNLGAILRSACFLGVRGIVLPKDRATGVTGTVMKVAAGAASYLHIAQVTNLVHCIEQLKRAGLWVIGLDLQGEQSLYEADLASPLALVVGNEQKGIRPLVRKHCDLLVKIPASGPVQSLNAAAAGTIALAEAQRRRLMESR